MYCYVMSGLIDSVFGIGVRNRKYADTLIAVFTPIRRSVCVRRYADLCVLRLSLRCMSTRPFCADGCYAG